MHRRTDPPRLIALGQSWQLGASSASNDLPFSGERRTVAASVTRQRGGAGVARAVAAQAHRRADDAGVRPLQRLVGRRARGYTRRMIYGAHVIIYSKDSEADRAFFRDVLNC